VSVTLKDTARAKADADSIKDTDSGICHECELVQQKPDMESLAHGLEEADGCTLYKVL
jgi:hypothetical protein